MKKAVTIFVLSVMAASAATASDLGRNAEPTTKIESSRKTDGSAETRLEDFPNPWSFIPAANIRKAAVLIASEWTEVDVDEFRMAYWYDTVLAYCALRKQGFTDDEIYVLYGDGMDGVAPSTTGPSAYYSLPNYCLDPDLKTKITDYPMSVPVEEGEPAYAACTLYDGEWRCAPKTIFDCLATGCAEPRKKFHCLTCPTDAIRALDENDFLVVWWRGHASVEPGSPSLLELNVGVNWISEEKLGAWLGRIRAKRRVLVLEACQSGCVGDPSPYQRAPIRDAKSTVFVLSCDCGEESEIMDTHDVNHAVFSFWLAGTVFGALPPGSQNPPNPPPPPAPQPPPFQLIHKTPLQSFATSRDATHREVGTIGGQPIQDPQIRSPESLASVGWPQ